MQSREMAVLRSVLLITALCLVNLCNRVVAQDFSCYESTDCRGAVVKTELPLRGECCGGRGLSFSLSGSSGDCRNCFSVEEFCSDGSEFYVAFFGNLFIPKIFSRADILLKINNMEDFPQTVTTLTYNSGLKEMIIGAKASGEISIPIDMRFGVGDTNKGVFIRSMEGARLSVTAFGVEYSSSDTYQVLPCVYLPSKYEYYAISVAKDSRIIVEDGVMFPAPPIGRSVVIFIAPEDNTKVTITPSQDVEMIPGTETLAGTQLELKLEERKAVFLSSDEDLTGTHVVSDKPLAFFSGHECGNMPSGLQFCDQMVEQIPPTATWGTEFYTASFMTRPRDIFRVLSSRDGNSLTWVCTGDSSTSDERDLPTAGVVVEFEVLANRFCRFTSRFPVLLVQFSVGGNRSTRADPSMAVVPPVGQYKDSYMLNYLITMNAINFVNIILLNTPGVTTDGTRLSGNEISGTWINIMCEGDSNNICAYGVQVMIRTLNGDGAVSLSHSNPEAKLLGVPYSTDIRTGRATFAGMTQKPIALDEVSLSESEYIVEEGSGEVVISITRSGNLLDNITTLFVATEIPEIANSARDGEDFTSVRREVLLPAGVSSISLAVGLGPDDIFPGVNKVFLVYLGPACGAFVSPTAHANVTINDTDPPLPVMEISFSHSVYLVDENDGFFEITLIKSEGARGPVTVSLSPLPDTAMAVTDFQLNETNITFRVSETEKVVPVIITNDDIIEDFESFFVTIEPVAGLFPVVVTRDLAVVEIRDNDFMLLAFQPSSARVAETVGVVRAELVVVKGGVDREVAVSLMTFPYTASDGSDYVGISGNITISPSTTRVPVQVEILDDLECEEKEMFSFEGFPSVSSRISLLNYLNITIVDDGCFPVVVMAADRTVVSEADREVNVTISVDTGGLSGAIRLGISTIPLNPKDSGSVGVEVLTQREVTLRGRESVRIRIGIEDNSVYDGGEDRTFAVVLSLLGSDFERVNVTSDYIEVRIVDDEPQPEGILCNIGGELTLVSTKEKCCVNSSGISYEQPPYTIPCIVIGFEQREYSVEERGEPYQFRLRVLQGSLGQNLTLTILSTSITAAANDYTVLDLWVRLVENGMGTTRVAISTEQGQEDQPRETFRLEIAEESGITPRNVFFRGSLVTISDQPTDLP